MSTNGVKFKGQKLLNKHIARMSNAPKVFDDDFRKTAINGIRDLVDTTPKDTHHTSKGWTKIKKIGLSEYSTQNKENTGGVRPLSLITILNDGRAEIRPVRAKKLYIPLTNKGKAKDKSAKFGIDFVLADKAKATKGTKFVDKSKQKSSREITRRMLAKIREVHG